MLSIHLHGKDEDATPWFYEGTIAELFRTVRVTNGYHAFVEVSSGHLINIAHIERIDEQPTDEGRALADDVERSQRDAMISAADRLRSGQTVPIEPRETGHEYRPRELCQHDNYVGTCLECLGQIL